MASPRITEDADLAQNNEVRMPHDVGGSGSGNVLLPSPIITESSPPDFDNLFFPYSTPSHFGPSRFIPDEVPQDITRDESLDLANMNFPETPQRYAAVLEELALAGGYQLSTPPENDQEASSNQDLPRPSNFERKNFHWLECETASPPVSRSRRKINSGPSCEQDIQPSCDVDQPLPTSPSEATTGYGADVEESPREGSRRHEASTLLRAQLSLEAAVVRGTSSILSPTRTNYSQDKKKGDNPAENAAENKPGGPSQRQRSVTFVDAVEVIDKVTSRHGKRDPFAFLDPFYNTKSPSGSPSGSRPRPRARALTSPPYSPLSGSIDGEGDSSWQMQIEDGFDHDSPPLSKCDGKQAKYDDNIAALLDDIDRDQLNYINVLGKKPRMPSKSPHLHSRTHTSRAGGLLSTIQLDDSPTRTEDLEYVPLDDDGPVGRDAGASAILERQWHESQALKTVTQRQDEGPAKQAMDWLAEADLEEALQEPLTASFMYSEQSEYPMPPEKRMKMFDWVSKTYDITFVRGDNKIDCPSSAYTSPTRSRTIGIDLIDFPTLDGETGESGIQRKATEEYGAEEKVEICTGLMQGSALTIGSGSAANESPTFLASVFMKRARRNAFGSSAVISPMPFRPARLPSVQQSVTKSPKPSPIMRALHLPWKLYQEKRMDEEEKAATPSPTQEASQSPTPASWLASRLPSWGGHSRSCSVPAAMRSAHSPSSPLQTEVLPSLRQRTMRELFSHRRVHSSAMERPRTPYTRFSLNDDEEEEMVDNRYATVFPMGLGIDMPPQASIEATGVIAKMTSSLVIGSPPLIDLSSPQVK
ncbi:hypothetical protein CBS101457_005648 [Exobasidium rhododendri]|nr:hypothetical protein CBS101457_005648 [Exobasidium rhododendri]